VTGSVRIMKKTFIVIFLFLILFIGIKFYIYDGAIPFWVKTDIGPEIHVFGRPCLWKSSRVQIGKTNYVASVGPNIYQDESDQEPDFYTIDIEKRHLFSNNWGIYFERNFEIGQIPKDLLYEDASKIIEYHDKERLVVFTIGKNRYEYTLPIF